MIVPMIVPITGSSLNRMPPTIPPPILAAIAFQLAPTRRLSRIVKPALLA